MGFVAEALKVNPITVYSLAPSTRTLFR